LDPSRGAEARFHHLSEILGLDLSNEAARFVDSGAQSTSPRRTFARAAVGDKSYLVGGMPDEFDTVHECEAFDVATASFSPIASPRKTRISREMVAPCGKLYLCGGSAHGEGGKLTPDRSIECYDPATNTWSVVVEERPPAIQLLRAFALRDRLLLVSSPVDAGDFAPRHGGAVIARQRPA